MKCKSEFLVRFKESSWKRFCEAFKILSEPRKGNKAKKDNKHVSLYQITEQSLRANFEKLFGYKCDILARVMYIKMS